MKLTNPKENPRVGSSATYTYMDSSSIATPQSINEGRYDCQRIFGLSDEALEVGVDGVGSGQLLRW